MTINVIFNLNSHKQSRRILSDSNQVLINKCPSLCANFLGIAAFNSNKYIFFKLPGNILYLCSAFYKSI